MAPRSLKFLFLATLFFDASHSSLHAISRIAPADWAALNASVNGNLFALRPFAFPCYTKYNGVAKPVDAAACADISAKKSNTEYITGQPGAFVMGNWGICQATNAGCPISPAGGIIDGNCAQGCVADYYINVQTASHVEEALKFANKNGIQVVVKNTGHDYLGRSSAPHSLAVWTHNLQPPIKLTEQFVPEGCSSSVGKVVTFGAGQQFDGIYKFAEANKITVLGGSGATVGPAGGWITGGGHGMLSPVFGLGVDNVQQFRVVLPSGTSVVANRCKNQEVFFALRGGGGGNFGVITEMTTIAHEQVTIQFARLSLPTLTKPQMRDFLKVLAANANRWLSEGWGGDSYPTTKRNLRFVNPLLDAAAAAKSMQPLMDFASSLPIRPGRVDMLTYPSWYQFYKDNLAIDYVNGANGGTAMSSRLIPSSSFDGTHNQEQLVDAFLEGASLSSNAVPIYPMLCMAMPARTPDDNSALHPAWRKASWHIMFITLWDPFKATVDGTRKSFDTVHQAMEPIRKLTPSTGVYLNEADVQEVDSPSVFWGAQNYQKLLKIKTQLDPNKVLQVHGGVGSDPKAKIFECYPQATSTAADSHDELK